MPSQYIDFNRVKAEASFEPILVRYNVRLQGTGPQRNALCIFHAEKRPSLKINLERKIFNCFGCGASGNILDFVMKTEGCSLKDAARIVVEACGLDLSGDKPGKPQKKPALNAKAAPAIAATPEAKSTAPLPSGAVSDSMGGSGGEVVNPPLTFTLKLEPEHPYLRGRGVSPELVKHFGLGYCARGLMKGRICIPIHDHLGQLVAYAGRWPGDDLPEGEERWKLPKGFKKTGVLYNLNRVKDSQHLVVLESYWGVFRLHTLGLAAVALMGRSIDPAQVELLDNTKARFITLLMDGDEPGRAAVPQILSLLTRDRFVRVMELPDATQPDTAPEEVLLNLRGHSPG